MFFQNVLPIMGIIVVIVVLGFMYCKITVLVPRQKAKEAKELAIEAFSSEKARVDALPKLNTQWLMYMKFINGNPIHRSYGTRYNRIFIIDECGCGWVGLITPELLSDLIAGEYIWNDYHIPFRGAGEAYAGKPVTIDGLRIDIYPMWMSESINPAEWALWTRIERNFDSCSRYSNYQSGLANLNQHQQEFREKRDEYKRLAILANAE